MSLFSKREREGEASLFSKREGGGKALLFSKREGGGKCHCSVREREGESVIV